MIVDDLLRPFLGAARQLVQRDENMAGPEDLNETRYRKAIQMAREQRAGGMALLY